MAAQTREELIAERCQLLRLAIEERFADGKASLFAECLMADHSLGWWKTQERKAIMMNKQDAWKKALPKPARALLAARKREYDKDRPKVFPSAYRGQQRRRTAAYVKEFCRLNKLIP